MNANELNKFSIPMKIESGNKTIGKHYRLYMKYRDKWFHALGFILSAKPARPNERFFVTIISYRKRYIDYENFAWGCKPIFDYLTQSNHIHDDSPHWVERKYLQFIDGKNERTEIVIEEIKSVTDNLKRKAKK